MSTIESGQKLGAESIERLPADRLETYLVFVRHGKSEKLEGADKDNTIDAKRRHLPEGEKQVYEGGRKFAEEVTLRPTDVIFERSSPRERAKQTVEGAVKGFLDAQKEKGVETFNIQQSINPTRKEFDLPLTGWGAYDAGGHRRGSTSGLCEEWIRKPDQYEADIKAAGLASFDVKRQLTELSDNFQHTVNIMDRASTLLRKRWESQLPEKTDTAKEDKKVEEPRLFLFVGSHGFMTEEWLREVVKDYEQESGTKVPLELGYGEYFTVHFPPNQSEPPTLNIKGLEITIKDEMLRKLDRNNDEPKS